MKTTTPDWSGSRAWKGKPKLQRNEHMWDAVCDEKGNQIGDMVYCDLCKKTVHMSQLNSKGQIKK